MDGITTCNRDPSGDADDLAHAALTARIHAEVHDEVDRRRDRRDNETGRHVLTRQQRQRAHLDQRLARGIGVEGAHARQPAVQCDEQIEALFLTHLADDESGRAHAQRFLHQAPQRDLARPFEIGLACLHADDVRRCDAEFEDLLDGDDALPSRDRAAQCVEHRRLA